MVNSKSTAKPLTSSPTSTIFADGLPLPKIIVFDADYTLWPFWIDTHVTPPLKTVNNGSQVQDRYREKFGFYEDVPSILAALKQHSILIGAASRTMAPAVARQMLSLLHVPTNSYLSPSATTSDNSSKTTSSVPSLATTNGTAEARVTRPAIDFFDHLQIFPGSKITHFTRIHKDTGIPYEEMLFFDDEARNKNVESLGVVMRLVRDGVTWSEFEEGVNSWRKAMRLG